MTRYVPLTATTMPKPTRDMCENFESRTREHIERVQKWLLRLDGVAGLGLSELETRGAAHDADKYDPDKVVPYIWVTEYYRLKNSDADIPSEVQDAYDLSRDATGDHVTINPHHPEAHEAPDSMQDLDVAEMVADWAAMAEELGEGSCRGWADSNVGSKWVFDDEHVSLIYECIDALDPFVTDPSGSES